MKTILVFAAALAALTNAPVVNAGELSGGHWECKARPTFGPKNSYLLTWVRVWVKDAANVANCDCARMHDKAATSTCMDNPSQSKG